MLRKDIIGLIAKQRNKEHYKMPEKEVLYHEPIAMHSFHHPSSSSPYSHQLPSAFVAFQTSPTTATHAPSVPSSTTCTSSNLMNAHSHLRGGNTTSSATSPGTAHQPISVSPSQQASANLMSHLHHHSSQAMSSHETSPSRYPTLWDPTSVAAANFHHPTAHGYVKQRCIFHLGSFSSFFFFFLFSVRFYDLSTPFHKCWTEIHSRKFTRIMTKNQLVAWNIFCIRRKFIIVNCNKVYTWIENICIQIQKKKK